MSVCEGDEDEEEDERKKGNRNHRLGLGWVFTWMFAYIFRRIRRWWMIWGNMLTTSISLVHCIIVIKWTQSAAREPHKRTIIDRRMTKCGKDAKDRKWRNREEKIENQYTITDSDSDIVCRSSVPFVQPNTHTKIVSSLTWNRIGRSTENITNYLMWYFKKRSQTHGQLNVLRHSHQSYINQINE